MLFLCIEMMYLFVNKLRTATCCLTLSVFVKDEKKVRNDHELVPSEPKFLSDSISLRHL